MTNNKTYFIANWKMYGNASSLKSIKNVIKLSKLRKFSKAKIIYCPPFTLLADFVKKTKLSKISVGAQDCHRSENYGAYTGSINSNMIKKTGSSYVIIGHSEKRQSGDTDTEINRKIKSAIKENLNVIFCIGETLKEKKSKKTDFVLKRQIKKGLNEIKKLNKIIIAYEPVWSIGTGIIPKMDNLKIQVHKIEKILKKEFKNKNPKIIYGGSVNSNNIDQLNKINNISGFLIGKSSQNSKIFIDIIKKTIN